MRVDGAVQFAPLLVDDSSNTRLRLFLNDPAVRGLGQSTVAAVATGDGTIVIHGTAGWSVSPVASREIALLLVDVLNNKTEIVLPTAGITRASGDQTVTVTRAGSLAAGEVAQTQTAQALIKQVQGSNLSIEMPTLSDSINAVRNYKAKP